MEEADPRELNGVKVFGSSVCPALVTSRSDLTLFLVGYPRTACLQGYGYYDIGAADVGC
jgi:hypothetical protein